MNSTLKKIIPAPTLIAREAIIVLGGLLIAAYVINRIPAVQAFIQRASITIRNDRGEVLF